MNRISFMKQTFGDAVPRLWCPLLTHFSAPGVPDEARMRRLMRSIAPSVGGILVPGSTGEGWDMNDDNIQTVLEIVLTEARNLGQHVLIGALKPTAELTIESIHRSLDLIRDMSGCNEPDAALTELGVAGFTICPPTGAELTQETIREAVAAVLDLGLPTALYQLPQVTQNEISPRAVSELCARFDNLFLFKDTSGADRVASASHDYAGLFLVRGAEGGYSEWTRAAGGPYDGLLLSTANTFAAELGGIFDLLEAGKKHQADAISARIATVVETLFPLAGDVPAGNAFANANKAIDHVRAWGPRWLDHPMPMLYGGSRLPETLVSSARQALVEQGFPVDRGYLE